MLARILTRRPRGAHRAVRPGPRPALVAVDPWAGFPLFELTFADRLVMQGELALAAQTRPTSSAPIYRQIVGAWRR